jgi:hypothetical protein
VLQHHCKALLNVLQCVWRVQGTCACHPRIMAFSSWGTAKWGTGAQGRQSTEMIGFLARGYKFLVKHFRRFWNNFVIECPFITKTWMLVSFFLLSHRSRKAYHIKVRKELFSVFSVRMVFIHVDNVFWSLFVMVDLGGLSREWIPISWQVCLNTTRNHDFYEGSWLYQVFEIIFLNV